MHPYLALAFGAIATLLPVLSSATVYTVGSPSTAGSCTHTTLQAAVNAAAAHAGPDEIYVSRNGVNGFTNQAVVIDNQDLTVIGGFGDCFPLAPTGITRLNGSGGTAAPVISIRSSNGTPVNVQLDRLEIINGDNTASFAQGGGLQVQARGQFTLSNLRIANNTAYYGAGVAVIGDQGDSATRMFIGDNVQIEDNSNSGSGGGIYVYNAYLRLGGINTVVRRNTAAGGGGISISAISAAQRASLDVLSGGQGDDGVVANNTAVNGGGGLVVGDFTTANLFTSDATRPVRIDHNHANYGGAIYASGGNARVRVWEGIIDSNDARYKGGAFVPANGAEIALYPVSAGGAPLGTVACPANDPCNLVSNNRAGVSFPTDGAVAMLTNFDDTVESRLILNTTILEGNNGYSLFSDGCDAPPTPCGLPASVRIVNSRIAPNFDAATLLAVYRGGTLFRCDLCTIASNGAGSSSALFESNATIELTRSILWEPGRDIIGTSAQPVVLAQSLLLHDASDFAGQADVRVADPQFMAQGAGDFRLGIGSSAIDAADVTDAPPTDLDGATRVIDQNGIPNRLGALDLGAYERAGDSDVIFRHAFE